MIPPHKQRPIFILGSARSGTTITTQALQAGAGVNGYQEGHFLSLLHALHETVDDHFSIKEPLRNNDRHAIAHLERSEVWERIVDATCSSFNALVSEPVWLDKTPDAPMILAVPHLLSYWPRARFVFVTRRGIENISSRLRKFPHVGFEHHCVIWAHTMASWLNIRGDLGDCFIEVEQRDIALHPEPTALKLAKFLGMSEVQSTGMCQIFKSRRPQKTTETSENEVRGIQQFGWSDEQIGTFRRVCGDINRLMGYTEDNLYTLPSAVMDAAPMTMEQSKPDNADSE